jgi:hypothetical protein
MSEDEMSGKRRSMTLGPWLDAVEKLSRMLSIGAIPVVLGVGGWVIQRQLQNHAIRRDYVQLAVTILQNPDTTKVPPELREWAADLLNENSPTKLKSQALGSLKSGVLTLPSFNFVPGSALPPQLRQTLEASLDAFKTYALGLGFEVPTEPIVVKISPGSVVEGGTAVATWNRDTNTIQVAGAFANDKESVLRQFAHTLFPLPNDLSWDYYAIESGLAAYFPCSFTNRPTVGEDATEAGKAILSPWDLRRSRRFSDVQLKDWASVQNDGSEVWGGFFWKLREVMGREKADRLLAETWRALPLSGKGTAYSAFSQELLSKSAQIDDNKHKAQILAALTYRGLKP